MIEKLTFKQYVESKELLRKSILNVPTALIEYEIKKYCVLTVGESEDDKISVSLKPKHRLIVEWKYETALNPTPQSVQIFGCEGVDDKIEVFWSGTKLQKWLSRHATPGKNCGHK